MSVRQDRRYTSEHEWAKPEGELVRVGITDYAQQELGDVVTIDLPQVGAQVKKGDSFSTVESVKAVSYIYAPVDGEVVEVNAALPDSPEQINQSPYDGGWIVVLRPSNAGQVETLMDATAYGAHVEEISK